VKHAEPLRREDPPSPWSPIRGFLSITLLALVLLLPAGFKTFSKGDGVDMPGAGGVPPVPPGNHFDMRNYP